MCDLLANYSLDEPSRPRKMWGWRQRQDKWGLGSGLEFYVDLRSSGELKTPEEGWASIKLQQLTSRKRLEIRKKGRQEMEWPRIRGWVLQPFIAKPWWLYKYECDCEPRWREFIITYFYVDTQRLTTELPNDCSCNAIGATAGNALCCLCIRACEQSLCGSAHMHQSAHTEHC